MNNTNNALETLVQRDKQIKKANDKLKASINELDAELETTTNALSNHASNTEIHTSKEELIKLIVDHLESLDLGITKEVVSVLPTENISDNTLYFVPNDKGSRDEYLYINDKWELVGSTETNFTDYYTKLETDTLLENKADSVHNHVVSDITDFPTIPTKTSQLINDSGFLTSSNGLITSVSWSDITNKPNFSKVAISGSYTDLSNTPTIPTKVSQLENDMGFGTGGDTSDCVHKTGNETISGIKTFTNGTWVTNNSTTNGYSIKLNAIARNEVPSQLYHATFRAYDKNDKILGEYCVEKSTGGDSLLNMNVRSEDASGNQIAYGLQFRMTNDGSIVRFIPSANNKVHLGDVNAKWLKIHSDDVVHTSGNETIAGNKTFSNQMYLGGGGTSYGLISAKDNNSILRLFGGTSPSTGANLDLYGENLSGGGFSLRARTSDKIVGLDGKIDGTLKWNGKNVALDENLVHTTGREVISGDKVFQNTIFRTADITTSTVETVYRFEDTNAKPCGSIYNKMHWYNNNVYNRHQSYNATSGKDMYFEVLSDNAGSGVVNTGGSVTNNKNLTTVTNSTNNSYVATMGWVNNPATSTNVVHRSGDETISGKKTFTQNVTIKNNDIDLMITPTSNKYSKFPFTDKNNKLLGIVQYAQRSTDVKDLDLYVYDKNSTAHGIQINSNNEVIPIGNNSYSLGSSSAKWANVYATTFNGNLKGNADSSTKSSCLDSYSLPGGNKIYLDWDKQVKDYVGLKVDNTNMGGLITTKSIGSQSVNYATNATQASYSNQLQAFTGDDFTGGNHFVKAIRSTSGWSTRLWMCYNGGTKTSNEISVAYADSATYATTQATSDNSTKIATTAWVRTYVNSVVGSGSIGASISAYYSNATTLTAEGDSTTSGNNYPSDYSNYINIAPTVGTIYTGSQLFSSLTPTASGTINKQSTGPNTKLYYTTAKATANFSGAFSSSARYLCTTANAVKFRAYVSQGSDSYMGSPSVVDNSSAKSIFIRVQ